MDSREWTKHIEAERSGKDLFFLADPQSPVSAEDREAFQGLKYYPPDPAYRFDLGLHEHASKDVVEMSDTAGGQRKMLRWGEFRFRLEDRECTLQAYRSGPDDDRLFVPFRDATNGDETYGAGRYLDLEGQTHATPEGHWILDFNKAYNPWCAYSEHFACPFVPAENCLTVAIRAGEKDYRPAGSREEVEAP